MNATRRYMLRGGLQSPRYERATVSDSKQQQSTTKTIYNVKQKPKPNKQKTTPKQQQKTKTTTTYNKQNHT